MSDELVTSLAAAWQNFGGVAVAGARIVAIVIAAWVGIGLAQRRIRALRIRIANRIDDREAVT